MPGPVVVKLGGSLLTDKSREATFRPEAAARLLAEVAAARLPTVLLHGAGSFGHPQVQRARLVPMAADRVGVAAVFAALSQLQAQVATAGRSARLPLVPVALAGAQVRRGRLKWDVAEVRDLLAAGFVPVLHGTLVPSEDGWAVLSADLLAAHLARTMKASRVLFATDVEGVFDRPPGEAGARLLPNVGGNAGWPAFVAGGASTGPGSDVTGRMAGKLQAAADAARHAPTLILNGNAPGRLLAAMQGRPVVGTRVSS